jgi:hypothetical protein
LLNDIMPSDVVLNVFINAECHVVMLSDEVLNVSISDECHVVMLSDVVLNVSVLSVVTPSVAMPNVTAPK